MTQSTFNKELRQYVVIRKPNFRVEISTKRKLCAPIRYIYSDQLQFKKDLAS